MSFQLQSMKHLPFELIPHTDILLGHARADITATPVSENSGRKGRGVSEIEQNVAAAQRGKGMSSLPYVIRIWLKTFVIFVGRRSLVTTVGSVAGGVSSGKHILVPLNLCAVS